MFNREIDNTIYEELVAGFSFNPLKIRKLKKLSQGNKVKAELIFILSNKNKELFFLDEPTASLDSESIEFLARFIRNNKRTFVVISHDEFFRNLFATKDLIFKDKKLLSHV